MSSGTGINGERDKVGGGYSASATGPLSDSSGVASGTTCLRLSQARSPAWTSQPAISSRPYSCA
jgi:hypothetical protein